MRIIFLFFLMLRFSCLNGQYLSQGDSSYVASKSGLIIRAEPTLNSEVVGKLSYNDIVIFSPTIFVDTIDNRIGEWVRIDRGVSGYIFGGYLNKYELPEKYYGVLSDYLPDFAKKFELLKVKKYSVVETGFSKRDEYKEVVLRAGLTIIDESGYEYGRTDYYFEDMHINEFINLFEIMKFYNGNLDREMKLKYVDSKMFQYEVPDAGMERNEVRQLDSGAVRLTFVYGL